MISQQPELVYSPLRIKTIIQNNNYEFIVFNELWKLKDHVCKHLLNPYEGWNQVIPQIDLPTIRNALLTSGCYSHYLTSPKNNYCKHCPYLSDQNCDLVIKSCLTAYSSSITQIIQQNTQKLICVSLTNQELLFYNEYGIFVFCEPTVVNYEYVVNTAYRVEITRKYPKPSRQEYFDQGWKKVTNKYLIQGKPLILRI